MYNRRRTSPAHASEFAKETLIGQRVSVAADPTQGVYDRCGRTVAQLDEGDGRDYSIEAAQAGKTRTQWLLPPRLVVSQISRHPQVSRADS
jgi:hypothetical protein